MFIKIVSPPRVDDEPPEIRKAWVGCIFPAEMPIGGIFTVETKVALDSLREISPFAAEWQRKKTLAGRPREVFAFHWDCCEEVDVPPRPPSPFMRCARS